MLVPPIGTTTPLGPESGGSGGTMTSIWGGRSMTTESGAGRNRSCSGKSRGRGEAWAGSPEGDNEPGWTVEGNCVSLNAAADWIANATNRTGKHALRCLPIILPRLRLTLSRHPTIEVCGIAHRRNGPLICYPPRFVNPNPLRIRWNCPTRPPLSGEGV